MTMDDLDAAEVQEFLEEFRATSEAIRAELKWTGEQATVRRVCEQGSSLERSVLLFALSGCENVLVKLGALEEADEETVRAYQETADRFLRGLLEGTPIDRADMRAAFSAWAKGAARTEGLLVLKPGDPNWEPKPFSEVAKWREEHGR